VSIPEKEVAKARARFKSTSQDALLLIRDPSPIALDAPGETFFAGLPKLPASVDWPTNASGAPLTFMAQIGLADVPTFTSRHLLPKSGVLFFFGEMWLASDRTDAPVAKVIYHPQSVAELSPREKPASMPTMCPDDPGVPRGWLPASDVWRQIDFRYALKPHRVKSYYSGPSDDEFDEAMHAAAEELEKEAFLAGLGEPRHVQMEARWNYPSQACLAWPDWPKSALHARSAMNAIDAIGIRHANFSDQSQQAYRELKATLDAIGSATEPFEDLAPLPADVQSLVRTLIAQFEDDRQTLLKPYYTEAIVWNAICFASQFCITNARPDLVPTAYDDAVRDRTGWRAMRGRPNAHGAVHIAHDCPRHQMFGHSRNRQNEAEEHRDKVLLFQLDGDQDFALYPQEAGSYYFHVKKSDLQRRNFDAVHFSAST